jgi:hypothetical protein
LESGFNGGPPDRVERLYAALPRRPTLENLMARATCALVAVLAALLLAGCQAAPRAPQTPVPPPTQVAPPSSTPAAAPPSTPPPPPVAAPGKQITIQLTGYSYADNTPPGSSQVCCSVLHRTAGGQGTFADPITVAVPGSGGRGMQFAQGTRFYLPTVRRYVIVEDSGASTYGLPHLDMWVDGRGGSIGAVENCMDAITGRVPAELNPPPGRPVLAGPISSGYGCHIP